MAVGHPTCAGVQSNVVWGTGYALIEGVQNLYEVCSKRRIRPGTCSAEPAMSSIGQVLMPACASPASPCTTPGPASEALRHESCSAFYAHNHPVACTNGLKDSMKFHCRSKMLDRTCVLTRADATHSDISRRSAEMRFCPILNGRFSPSEVGCSRTVSILLFNPSNCCTVTTDHANKIPDTVSRTAGTPVR